jgi:ketosteroid isomerase-like protein
MNPIRLFGITATLLVLSISSVHAAADPTAIQSAVRAVLDQQVKDWNAGDIGKFMRGYDRSEKTRFASGGNITLGWQAVLERYQRTYSDKATMGTLTFSDIDITVASEDTALAFGRWHLKREKDEPSGLFTLLFRKTSDGWKIVHDHTSAAEKK